MKYLLSLSLFAFGITSLAAASDPFTRSYAKLLDTGIQADDSLYAMTADSAGNGYVVVYNPIQSLSLWTVMKFDRYGNPAWSKSLTFNFGTPLASQVDSLGNLFVMGQAIGNGTSFDVVLVKFDSLGNIRWVQQHDNGDKSFETPLSISPDGTGGARVAVDGTLNNQAALLVEAFDSNGVLSVAKGFTDKTISIDNAKFNRDGYLIVTGIDSATNHPRFTIYDPTYNVVKTAILPSSASVTYSYLFSADAAGTFEVAANRKDAGGTTSVIQCFDETGATLWTTPLLPQTLQVAGSGSSNVYARFPGSLARVDSTGLIWSVPTTGFGLAVDAANGVALMREDDPNSAKVIYIDKYNSVGGLSWTSSTSSLGTFTAVQGQALLFQNGALYYQGLGLLGNPVNKARGLFQKFTQGAQLSTITAQATSIIGGSGNSATLKLVGTTASTSVVKLLCDSPFLNVPSTATILKNQATGSFKMTSAVVDAVTKVLVTARLGDNQRVSAITLNPNVLSNLALPNTTVKGGTNLTATVTLSGPTGLVGRVVTLKSSNLAYATVPASVTIAAGASSATFTVKTKLGANGTTTLTATALGVTLSQDLKITP